MIDLETTVTNYRRDRIIEIYIVKVRNGVEIAKYHSITNPLITP